VEIIFPHYNVRYIVLNDDMDASKETNESKKELSTKKRELEKSK